MAHAQPDDARIGSGAHSLGAHRQAVRLKSRQAARASPDKGRATQERAQPLPTGRSPCRAGSPLGCGVRPIAGLSSRRRARRRRRRQARAARQRGGRSHSPPGEVRVGPGAYLYMVRPSAGLRGRRRDRRRGRRRHARSKSRQAARASPGKGAQAAKQAQSDAGGQKQSLPAGRSSGRAGSHPLVRGPAPAPVCAAEGARLQRRRQVRSERRTESRWGSHAGEGAASPNQAKPRSGREVSRVESCPEPACALECVPRAERRWRVPCL